MQEFPQYYPVWRKLAEVYNSEDNQEMVMCSYEEGVKYIPISADLWLHYCIWKSDHSPVEETRSLFEKATQTCGKVYTSNLLWDKFLDFEKTQKNFEAMEKIFWNLLTFPTTKSYEYYTRFKNFIDSHYKESEDIRKKKMDEIVQAYEKVVTENNKRKTFEQGIKRSNFSTKPLDAEQLQNWRRYLDFEERENDFERIRLLYERCVAPTCYYSEFWIRYAKFLEKSMGVEAARELYMRANKSFLSHRADLFVAQGYFEEVHKNIDEARRLYKHAYEQVTPGLLSGIFSHIRLERRARNFNEVDRLFKYAMTVAEEGGHSGNLLYVTAEYSHFHQFVMQDLTKAIQICESALEKAADKKALFYVYISVLNCLDNVETKLSKIKSTFEFALKSDSVLPLADQLEIWVSYMDFIRNSWKNTEDVREVENRYRKVFHHQNILTGEFKNKCKIKRMKRSEAYEYPEAIKKPHLG